MLTCKMFELDGDLDLDEDFLEGVFQSENEGSKKREAETEESFFAIYDAGQSSKKYKRNNDNFDNNNEVKRYNNVCLPTMERKTSKELSRFDSTDDLKTNQDMFSHDKEIEEVCQSVVIREIAPVIFPQHIPVRQRKFPGPAGLLPERDEMLKQSVLPALTTVAGSSEEAVCSQSSSSVFESSLWLQMTSDFGLKDKCSSLTQFNIKWVKKHAAAKQLLDQKVPFLALVLHDMDCSSPDPCFTLRDASGEIHGTLHREVWERYGGQLQPGSVLVLRQVGVLSTGLSARRHYLNVTANNILSIYSSRDGNNMRNTVVQKISHSELLSSVSKRRARTTPHTLYSTDGSSALRERTNLSPMLNMSPQLPAHQFVKRVSPSSDAPPCSSLNTDLLLAMPKQSTSVVNLDFQQVEVTKQVTSPLIFKGGFTPKVSRFGNLSKMSAVNASPSSPIPNFIKYSDSSTPVPNSKNSSSLFPNSRNSSTPFPNSTNSRVIIPNYKNSSTPVPNSINSSTPISNAYSALRNSRTPILNCSTTVPNSKHSTLDADSTSKQYGSCSVSQQQDIDVLEGLDTSCLFDDF